MFPTASVGFVVVIESSWATSRCTSRLWSGVKVTEEYIESVEDIVKTVYDRLSGGVVTLIENDPEFKNLSNNPS